MISKINGYDIYLALGIKLNGDRSTTNSFELPNDVNPVFSHTWEDGIVEYDLDADPTLVPRIFTINGWVISDNLDDYQSTKVAISSIIYQNYVTLEDDELDIKVNARLRPGGNKWSRLTPLDGQVIAAVEFQFDEVLQDTPFKNDGAGGGIIYYMGYNNNYLLTGDNENYIK